MFRANRFCFKEGKALPNVSTLPLSLIANSETGIWRGKKPHHGRWPFFLPIPELYPHRNAPLESSRSTNSFQKSNFKPWELIPFTMNLVLHSLMTLFFLRKDYLRDITLEKTEMCRKYVKKIILFPHVSRLLEGRREGGSVYYSLDTLEPQWPSWASLLVPPWVS